MQVDPAAPSFKAVALLALLSIGLVPAALEALKRVIQHPLDMSSRAVARVVVETALAPLSAGAIVRALLLVSPTAFDGWSIVLRGSS
jgi:hypothetical protein